MILMLAVEDDTEDNTAPVASVSVDASASIDANSDSLSDSWNFYRNQNYKGGSTCWSIEKLCNVSSAYAERKDGSLRAALKTTRSCLQL